MLTTIIKIDRIIERLERGGENRSLKDR